VQLFLLVCPSLFNGLYCFFGWFALLPLLIYVFILAAPRSFFCCFKGLFLLPQLIGIQFITNPHGWCRQMPRLVLPSAAVGAANCGGWFEQMLHLFL